LFGFDSKEINIRTGPYHESCTVKPVYNDHFNGTGNVVLIGLKLYALFNNRKNETALSFYGRCPRRQV
jgi:hypothetical protein